MKILKVSLAFLVVALAGAIAWNLIGTRQLPDVAAGDGDELSVLIANSENESKKGVADFGVWRIDESKGEVLYFMTKAVPADGELRLGGQVLKIFDRNRKLIYEEKAVSFDSIRIFSILRQSTPQLVIESVNYGGSGRFFKVFDFRENKVVEITDEDETLYSGGVQILPQYHLPNYFGVPYQVWLSENLASPTADATVLRYVDGKFKKVGTIEQNAVGKFLEEKMMRGKKE